MEYDSLVYATALSGIFSGRCAAGIQLASLFDDISEIFSLNGKELAGILRPADSAFAKILDPSTLEWARSEVDWARASGVDLLYMDDERYPRRLRECADAPMMLYSRGPADLNAGKVLSVVGTRRSTYYGREYCRRLIFHLAETGADPLIVSGLALGIDGCAHQAALDAGLKTVAVLPCAADTIYPQRHRDLASRIVEKGAVVTDFPRGTPLMAHTFVRRNRIIAGMADAVLLAESYRPGGGMITASLANSYDRDVFAVPGRNTDESFAGCNHLITCNSAVLVSSPDTIPEHMGWQTSSTLFGDQGAGGLRNRVENEAGRKIVEALRQRSPLSSEELLCCSGLDFKEFSVALLELEMNGTVRAVPGGRYDLQSGL